jgi:hypothetical protein
MVPGDRPEVVAALDPVSLFLTGARALLATATATATATGAAATGASSTLVTAAA